MAESVAEAAVVGSNRIVHRLRDGVTLDVLERHGLSSDVERGDWLPQMALLALGLLVKFLRGDLTRYAIQVLERLDFRRRLGLGRKTRSVAPAHLYVRTLDPRCAVAALTRRMVRGWDRTSDPSRAKRGSPLGYAPGGSS